MLSGEKMKLLYYYIRDRELKPMITICLAVCDTKIARGISICSILETSPDKSDGRNRACGRAIKALLSGESSEPIARCAALRDFTRCDMQYWVPSFKSEFDPVLTEYELEIIGSSKDN